MIHEQVTSHASQHCCTGTDNAQRHKACGRASEYDWRAQLWVIAQCSRVLTTHCTEREVGGEGGGGVWSKHVQYVPPIVIYRHTAIKPIYLVLPCCSGGGKPFRPSFHLRHAPLVYLITIQSATVSEDFNSIFKQTSKLAVRHQGAL